MEWTEIKRRLKDGTSVQILADLEGVAYKTMYNRIKQHELKDGVVYMKPEQLNTRRKKQPEVIEPNPEEKKVAYKKPEVIEAAKQKIECRENEIVVHSSPEAQKAVEGHMERLQQASDKIVSAYGEMMKKVGEKLREAIPTPEVKIQVVEDAEKGPEEEGGSPELTEAKSNICDICIHNLVKSCEFGSRRADFRRSGCNKYKNKDEYMNDVINEVRAEEAGTQSECPEEERGTPEEKWQAQKLSRVADKIIDELDQRIDHLNDELQRIEDKKIELLYEVGIWKNIMNALQRERGIK